MTHPISAQFIDSMAAGIVYWQKATAVIDEQTITRLDKERQNLYRAVRYGLKLAETWRETAVLASQSFPLIEQRGYWDEWIPILEEAIACCSEEDTVLICTLLNRLGQAYRLDRQIDRAIAKHQRSEALASRAGDAQALAQARYNLSQTYLYARNYVEAEQVGLTALAWFEHAAQSHPWLMFTLNTLGEAARFQGKAEAAAAYYERAIGLARSKKQPLYIARFLSNQALNWQGNGRYPEAIAALNEASDILASTAYELDKITVQNNVGLLHYRLGQWAEALVAFRQADSDYLRRSPNVHLQALISSNIGNVLLKQEKYAEAEAYLQRAVDQWQRADDKLEMANSIGSLGEALVGQGQEGQALAYLQQALELLTQFPQDVWAQKLKADFGRQVEALKL